MKWTPEKRRLIFDRTSGKCHICHGVLEYLAYGKDVGWEVEHSLPRAKGGTDRLNNLYPAHIACNRSKGVKSTPTARKLFNKRKAPLSFEKRKKVKLEFGFLNGTGMALVAAALRIHPTTGLLLAAGTAIVTFLRDPDDYI